MDELAEWDIVTGVGITALQVAAGRAIESHRVGGLIADPYAETFVEAAAPPVPMPTRIADAADLEVPWDAMATYMGVRSRYFDDFFAAAAADGIEQVVLLAAGLDVRAYRLDWPPRTVVYELDAPKVLAFKDEVLAACDARTRADRRIVPVDLRDDWAPPLQSAGFDRTRPSAWLAEGLFPFLPNTAKQRLLEGVGELSAPGSRLQLEHVADVRVMLDDERFRRLGTRLGIDMSSLLPVEDDFGPATWLSGHGWDVASARASEVAARFGRDLDDLGHDPGRSSLFVTAVRA